MLFVDGTFKKTFTQLKKPSRKKAYVDMVFDELENWRRRRIEHTGQFETLQNVKGGDRRLADEVNSLPTLRQTATRPTTVQIMTPMFVILTATYLWDGEKISRNDVVHNLLLWRSNQVKVHRSVAKKIGDIYSYSIMSTY